MPKLPTPIFTVSAVAGMLASLAGCGRRGDLPPPHSDQQRVAAQPTPIAADAGPPPLSEAIARTLLAAQFRRAGLRIRYDVRIIGPGYELTADGYDPGKKIGYEYIDRRERGTDLVDSERRSLAAGDQHALLIIDATSREDLLAKAESFLALHVGQE